MLKQYFTIIIFSCLFFSSFAQSTIEDWVYEGIALHDKGQYDKAVLSYKKALKINKKSPLALYEMAYTYMQKGDYKNAVKYSKKVLKINKKYILESYLVNGSALDLIGKSSKGIQTLEKASEKYAESHLVFFNLGIIHTKMGNLAEAKHTLSKALEENPNHANSHLALAQVQLSSENMSHAALSYLYFLLLEPDSKRSMMAHRYLSTVMDSPKYKVEKTDEDQSLSKDFEILFKTVEKMEEQSTKKSDIYSNLYIPIFNAILQKELTETLEYYIGQHQGAMNTSWLKQHQEKVNQLLKVLPKS